GKRNVLAGCFDQRKLESGLALEPPSRHELRGRWVDADNARAAAREPRREICRAAAELDDVEVTHIAEDVELRFRGFPDSPGDLFLRPRCRCSGVGVLRVSLGPVRDV